jgi:hypothetical protein
VKEKKQSIMYHARAKTRRQNEEEERLPPYSCECLTNALQCRAWRTEQQKASCMHQSKRRNNWTLTIPWNASATSLWGRRWRKQQRIDTNDTREGIGHDHQPAEQAEGQTRGRDMVKGRRDIAGHRIRPARRLAPGSCLSCVGHNSNSGVGALKRQAGRD